MNALNLPGVRTFDQMQEQMLADLKAILRPSGKGWTYDFEDYEGLPNSNTYRIYDDGGFEIARCSREEIAQSICDDHNHKRPPKVAILEALENAEEYFDDRADAEYIDGRMHGNKEMHLLGEVRDAIVEVKAQS